MDLEAQQLVVYSGVFEVGVGYYKVIIESLTVYLQNFGWVQNTLLNQFNPNL